MAGRSSGKPDANLIEGADVSMSGLATSHSLHPPYNTLYSGSIVHLGREQQGWKSLADIPGHQLKLNLPALKEGAPQMFCGHHSIVMLLVQPSCSSIVGVTVEGETLTAPVPGRLHR